MLKTILTVRDTIVNWGVDLTFGIVSAIKKTTKGDAQFPFTLSDLHRFPSGSLGYQVAEALQRKGLGLIPHYETHDIRHILYDYPMTLEGEVQMMAFQAGCKNGWKNVFVWVCLVVSVPTMPDRWQMLLKSYRRGKRLKNIDMTPDFIALLHLPLYQARAEVGLGFTLF